MDEPKKKNRSINEIFLQSEDYRKELTRLTKEKADKMALENEIRRKRYYKKSDVEKNWMDILTNIRSRFLSLPSKLGAQLALTETAVEASNILERAINDVLRELQTEEMEEEGV